MVSRANTLGVVILTRDLDCKMPRLDIATTSQAVPLFSKARFLGNVNRAYWYFVVESFLSSPINSLDDGHRQ